MKKNIVFKLLSILMVMICAFTMTSINSFAASKATLSKSSIKMVVGAATTLKVTGTADSIKWSSSDKTIASVSSKGKVSGKSKGTCYIYAKTGKTTLKCKVTVLSGTIKVDKTSETIVGINKTATIKGTFSGKEQSIKVSCKNPDIISAKITTSGKNFTIKVVSKAVGKADLTIYLTGDSTIKKKVTITVVDEISENTAVLAEDAPLTNDEELCLKVAELVNEERAARGLSALSYDADLNTIANFRAQELIDSFSHTRPNGESCFTAFNEVGKNNYTNATMGENIAWGQIDAEDVMDSWMNSKGHRAAILSDSYKKIGVGVVKSNGRYYWVQVFSN